MRGRNPQPIVPHFDFESLQAPWIFQAQGQGVFGADSRNFWPSGHKKPLSFTAELSREVVHEQESIKFAKESDVPFCRVLSLIHPVRAGADPRGTSVL